MEVSDVPPALRERLGVEATTGLLELFKTAHDECMTDVTTTVVDRFERRLTEEANGLRAALAQSTEALRLEFAGLRTEMHDGDGALRLEMREADNALRLEIRELGASVRGDIAALRQENVAGRFELLKWCFVFWVAQVFAVGGIVAVVLRLMRV